MKEQELEGNPEENKLLLGTLKNILEDFPWQNLNNLLHQWEDKQSHHLAKGHLFRILQLYNMVIQI